MSSIPLCSVPDCEKPRQSREYCSMHYRRFRRNGTIERIRQPQGPICQVENCEKPTASNNFCTAHYWRHKNGVDLHKPVRIMDSTRGCKIDGCEERHGAQGYCKMHYERWKKGRPMNPPSREKRNGCSVPGCLEKHTGLGYCRAHYQRYRKGQPLDDKPIRRMREIGEKFVHPTGYVSIKVGPDDWQLEHRYVMEQHLGRKLFDHENIHHVSGQRADNRLSNLQLWSVSQPAGQRVADKIEWAKEFLAQYDGTQLSMWD